MGEYAEMMVNGECCEACGEYLGFGSGVPSYCSKACAEGRGAKWASETPRPPIKKTKCPECGRKVKFAGLRDHLRDMHSSGKATP